MKINSWDIAPASAITLLIGLMSIISYDSAMNSQPRRLDSMVLQQYRNKQVRKMREQRNAESSLDTIFQKYDSNKDGVLDRKELEGYFSNKR